MSTSADPYYELAMEVVLSALRDMREGTVKEQVLAARDVLAGGLEHWLCQVCGDEATYEALRQELYRMAKERQRAGALAAFNPPNTRGAGKKKYTTEDQQKTRGRPRVPKIVDNSVK